ncbi:MAG: immunity 17 family protein [Planctomycetota bacterium]
MIHGHEDLFVGTAAVVLGLFLIVCAVSDWDWYYSVHTARWLGHRLGRRGARIVHALLGVVLIVLGVTIVLGYRWTLASR